MIELSNPATGTHGRVALVTGAARGIGLGIAAWLISEGWQVVLTDLDRVRGSKVAKVLGDNAWFIAMDVSNEGQVALGVAEVLGQFGRLDALVCNAAVADPHNITLESSIWLLESRVGSESQWADVTGQALCAVSACSQRRNRQPGLDPCRAVGT